MTLKSGTVGGFPHLPISKAGMLPMEGCDVGRGFHESCLVVGLGIGHWTQMVNAKLLVHALLDANLAKLNNPPKQNQTFNQANMEKH